MILKINDGLYIYGGIKGLTRDGNDLGSHLNSIKPDIILITISPEEVNGIKYFIENPFEMSLSDYEIIYGVNLSKYGEVMTPSPIYIETAKYSNKNNIDIIGIDMDEEEYQKAYAQNIKVFDLLRHSMRKKKISRIKFENETPEDYVAKWNETVDVGGFYKLNRIRLNYMIKKADSIIDENGNKKIMFVSDYDYYPEISEYFDHKKM